MNQRKQNMSRWYSLGLAAVLVIACLVMSVGVTWARYRTEVDQSIQFQTRAPLSVYLGKMVPSEDGTTRVFTYTDESAWAYVDGQTQMDFAVANGTSEEEFEARTQQFHIRLVGSLGAWSGEETAAIRILKPGYHPEDLVEDPQTAEPSEETETTEPVEDPWAKATAVRIAPDTQLYRTFGDGWVFCFPDEGSGKELTWTLEGGQLSCLELSIAIDSGTLVDTSLLQLQIVGEFNEG